MRQYGEVPPWLAADNTPLVKSTSGLGTGGGAGVNTSDSGGFGDILVRVGNGVGSSGNIVISFPSTPPTLFIAGNDKFGAITQSTNTNDVTIAWTGAKLAPSSVPYIIHYEWSVSK